MTVRKADSMFSPQPNGLRFAVMCNGTEFHRWQADAIRDLIAKGHKVVLLIRDARRISSSARQKKKGIKPAQKKLFNYLMRVMFEPDAKRLVDLSAELQNVDTLACHVEKRGSAEYFIGAEVQAIHTYRPDFILRFAFNIIRGEILTVAKYGVWSFHHDDEMKYRGGPAGFWEIYKGDPVTGAIMQRLTERLDAGIILKKAYLKTVFHSYKGNLEQLFTCSSVWPGMVADEIRENPEQTLLPSGTNAPIYKVPGAFRSLIFLFLLFRNRLLFYYRELFMAEIWNVGLIKKPIEEVLFGPEKLRPGDITWLRLFSATKYLADPMGFMDGPKLHILVEDYSYKTQKANISEIIWNSTRDSFSAPIRIIEEKDHLSYPFIVSHEKSVYCIPESYRSGMIILYKRNYSEESFIEEKILLSGVNAIDTTLVYHDNLWWLFFTEKINSWTHLQLYYAEELMGPYKPHRRNPVKTDIRSSRPGGTPFIHNNILYRPAQDCSKAYGGSLTINRVDKLTPDEYDETPVANLEPLRGSPFNKGLHTISQVGKYTLIDGKKYRFNYHFFKHQLTLKIANLRKTDVQKNPGNDRNTPR